MRKYNKAKGTFVHHKLHKILKKISNKTHEKHAIWKRVNIFLDAVRGLTDAAIARLYNVSINFVARWRKRLTDALSMLNHIAQKRPESLENKVYEVLNDKARSGRPPKFDAVTRTFVIGIACNTPEDYGYIRSHWSLPVLRNVILSKNIVPEISCATISRILKEADLKPYKHRYWLHSTEKGENPSTYKQKIHEINGIYFTASMIRQFGGDSDLRVISTDEMTGIQALEHKYPDKPALPHMSAKTEFEYIRHGTISLTAFFDVVTGRIVHPYINKTRTSEDFVKALSGLISSDPDKYWVIVADNLNTHYSEAAVRFVAEQCGITDLDERVLKNTKTRIEFLISSQNTICFYAKTLFLDEPD